MSGIISSPGSLLGNAFMDFDNSGFVVNVGPGSATSANNKTVPTASQQLGTTNMLANNATGMIGALLGSPLGLAALGLGVYFFVKHHA